MTNTLPPPTDTLAPLAATEVQRLAAQMAQDAFARIFRLGIEGTPTELDEAVGEIARRAANWSQAAADDEGRALRLALFIAGLDQWGLAYAQAFTLPAIPGLSALIGCLRNPLPPQAEARLQQQFETIDASDGNAIDFKLELRRHVHLALWSALISAESDVETESIGRVLGSLLLALDARMPTVGWRLIADALAHMQVRCLGETLPPQAEERTATLFDALRAQLPPQRASAIFTLANQAAAQWQLAVRSHSTTDREMVH